MNYKNKPNSELWYHGHCVSLLKDHLVICPKFRAKIMTGKIRDYLDFTIRLICRRLNVRIIRMAIAPDHVHIFYQYPPDLSPMLIKKRIKGVSSRLLRQAFPELKEWCKDSFWSRAAFHGSVGHGSDVVEKYIETQA
jgi:putative transposase